MPSVKNTRSLELPDLPDGNLLIIKSSSGKGVKRKNKKVSKKAKTKKKVGIESKKNKAKPERGKQKRDKSKEKQAFTFAQRLKKKLISKIIRQKSDNLKTTKTKATDMEPVNVNKSIAPPTPPDKESKRKDEHNIVQDAKPAEKSGDESNIKMEEHFVIKGGHKIKTIGDLKEILKYMDNHTFKHHVRKKRNDFAEWVKHVIKDAELAQKMKKATSRDEMIDLIEQKEKEQEIKEYISKLEASLREADSILAKQSDELAEKEEIIQQKDLEIENLKKGITSGLIKRLKEKIKALNDKKINLQNQVSQLKNEIKISQEMLVDKDNEIKKLNRKIERLNNELNAQIEKYNELLSMKDKKIEQLNEENAKLNQDIANYNKLKKIVLSLEKQINGKNNELNEIRDKLDKSLKELEDKNTLIENLKKINSELSKDKEQYKALQNKFLNLKNKYNEVVKQVKKLKYELKKKDKIILSKDKELNNKDLKIKEIKEQNRISSNRVLEEESKRILKREQEIIKKSEELAKKEHSLEKREIEIAHAIQELKQNKERYAKLQEMEIELKKREDELRKRINNCLQHEKELESESKRLLTMKRELDSLRESILNREKRVLELEKQVIQKQSIIFEVNDKNSGMLNQKELGEEMENMHKAVVNNKVSPKSLSVYQEPTIGLQSKSDDDNERNSESIDYETNLDYSQSIQELPIVKKSTNQELDGIDLIRNMINEVRELIALEKLAKAKVILSDIKQRMSNLSPKEQEILKYEIMDLETSLKLASLKI